MIFVWMKSFSPKQRTKVRLNNDLLKHPVWPPAFQIRDACGLSNDSDNPAEVFLIDSLAINKISCVSFRELITRDWEDIAIGPDQSPEKICVRGRDWRQQCEV